MTAAGLNLSGSGSNPVAVTKNIGLLPRLKQLLTESSLKIISLLHVDSYMNYKNIAWVNANINK